MHSYEKADIDKNLNFVDYVDSVFLGTFYEVEKPYW